MNIHVIAWPDTDPGRVPDVRVFLVEDDDLSIRVSRHFSKVPLSINTVRQFQGSHVSAADDLPIIHREDTTTVRDVLHRLNLLGPDPDHTDLMRASNLKAMEDNIAKLFVDEVGRVHLVTTPLHPPRDLWGVTING